MFHLGLVYCIPMPRGTGIAYVRKTSQARILLGQPFAKETHVKTMKLVITLLLILAAACLAIFTKGLWALTGIVPAAAAFCLAYNTLSQMFGRKMPLEDQGSALRTIRQGMSNAPNSARRVKTVRYPPGPRANPAAEQPVDRLQCPAECAACHDENKCVPQPADSAPPAPVIPPAKPPQPKPAVILLAEIGDDTYFMIEGGEDVYFKDRRGLLWIVKKGPGGAMVKKKASIRQDSPVTRTFTPGEARKAIASQV